MPQETSQADTPTLPGDEVVEIFVDPDGDEVSYYELEFSPLNVQYDLFNFIPEPPADDVDDLLSAAAGADFWV